VAGIVEGKSLEQSIDMGHWLASLSIKELGPQYVCLSLSTIPRFLSHYISFIRTQHNPCLKIGQSFLEFMLLHAISD